MKQRPPTEAAAALAPYRDLLGRYQDTLDLMSPTGYERLEEHLADAFTYADVIADLSPTAHHLLDIGSGAGLPAIAIAAALPDLQVELVERRRKRATFLSMAIGAIGAGRTLVRSDDARNVMGPGVDVVTAQAVGALADVYCLTRHRHAPTVTVLSRKGPEWMDEVSRLEAVASTAATVVAEVPLTHRGTLVAVQLQGGRPCRSSG